MAPAVLLCRWHASRTLPLTRLLVLQQASRRSSLALGGVACCISSCKEQKQQRREVAAGRHGSAGAGAGAQLQRREGTSAARCDALTSKAGEYGFVG